MTQASCIAVLGTGSDVGKSVLTTAFCRFLIQEGLRTAPYKAQNMSNNSGVTAEGLEMGRAQIVQAEAARIAPHVAMNPILLKPTTDVGAQVVLMGKAVANQTAAEYHKDKEHLFRAACEALDELRHQYDAVVMEGAGSCAEVNLMAHDIVNLRMAEYADAPVILVADIHRGGVFAQIVGTLECLPPNFRNRIAGFIVNRFRGDLNLFRDGVEWIEEKTAKPVFGVLPHFNHFRIEAEDSVEIERPPAVFAGKLMQPAVAVIRIPHISNFTDFQPLSDLEGLHVYFLEQAQSLDGFAAVILPGSKNTRFDLDWLKDKGWSDAIRTYMDGGGHVLGICGGYQLMGDAVHDPDGIEGPAGTTAGLGLLPVETVLKAPKTTTRTRFSWQSAEGLGYEIHMGQTERLGGAPMLEILAQNGVPRTGRDGCVAADGKAMGTYIHGLFDSPGVLKKWLDAIGLGHLPVPEISGMMARDRAYDQLADHFRAHIDSEAILALIGKGGK